MTPLILTDCCDVVGGVETGRNEADSDHPEAGAAEQSGWIRYTAASR